MNISTSRSPGVPYRSTAYCCKAADFGGAESSFDEKQKNQKEEKLCLYLSPLGAWRSHLAAVYARLLGCEKTIVPVSFTIDDATAFIEFHDTSAVEFPPVLHHFELWVSILDRQHRHLHRS